VPPWLVADWPLVGLCLIIMLVVLFGVSAVYGGVAAVVAAGSIKALVPGVTVGAYLAFSAFGVKTVAANSGASSVIVATRFLPLPWLALPIGATWLGLRFAFPRLSRDRVSVLAFAAKLAVSFGIVMAILAAVLSVGAARGEDATGFGARVSGGEAWAYSTFIVAVAALVIMSLRGTTVVPSRFGAQLRDIGGLAVDGARAYALMAAALAVVTIVAAVIVVDTGTARLSTVLGTLFMGISMGVVAASYAMGAAIGLGSGHTSLLKFGFPPSSSAGAAPVPFFLLLVVAPAVVAWTVWRRLERDRPATQQEVMKVGFAIAIAFSLVAWLAALVSRVVLTTGATKSGSSRGTGTFLVARPSVGGVLGLSLLWALLGGLGAAFYWSTQRGVAWKTPQGDTAAASSGRLQDFAPPAPPPAASPPPAATRPAAGDACSNCGAPLTAAGPFCANCGTRVT